MIREMPGFAESAIKGGKLQTPPAVERAGERDRGEEAKGMYGKQASKID